MTEVNYAEILAEAARGVQIGETRALEEMYRRVLPNLKAFLALRVPRDMIEDYSHDIFIALIKFIETGSVREPRCLPGIIRTIALRIISERRRARHAELPTINSDDLERFVPDPRFDLEIIFQRQQQMEVALSTLAMLKAREREVLKRFYLEEQTQEQICRDMGLTETQFRLLKSRAKARFGKLGRKRMRKSLSRVA